MILILQYCIGIYLFFIFLKPDIPPRTDTSEGSCKGVCVKIIKAIMRAEKNCCCLCQGLLQVQSYRPLAGHYSIMLVFLAPLV